MRLKNARGRLAGLAAGGLLLLAMQPGIAGTISGSKHDLSANAWSGGQICIVCHAPHNTNATYKPLWNHTVTSSVFTLYSNSTFDGTGTIGQPAGVSKLCLSCHDGTVAVDSYGGAVGTTFIAASANVGTDLSNDHPIGFTYNTALATTDGALFDPSTKSVTIGSGAKTKTGTIDAVMLYSGKLECASCHDVHNTFTTGTGAKLLKIASAASAICLACHDK